MTIQIYPMTVFVTSADYGAPLQVFPSRQCLCEKTSFVKSNREVLVRRKIPRILVYLGLLIINVFLAVTYSAPRYEA